jgi:SAM-dependent methyltransferase
MIPAPDIVSETYMRHRQQPAPGDALYLHLSDLLMAIKECMPHPLPQKVLDYGCGSSPYKFLFGSATYLRADLPHIANIDFAINQSGGVDVPSETIDLVLSSQVLEHVPDPALYLSECWRVLKPGGILLLSTHGLFEDHGCPFDFHRWTADGLKKTVEKAGFQTQKLKKLTSNKRALAFYQDHYGHLLRWTRKSFFGIFYWLLDLAISKRRSAYHRWCDAKFPDCRVVDASSKHSFYVGLMICAVK